MNLTTEIVWYYVDDVSGATVGPISGSDLRKKAFWTNDLLIYREGLEDWATYGQLLAAKDPYLIGAAAVAVPLPPGQRPLFYCADGSKVEGPVDPIVIANLIKEGKLTTSVQVCELNSDKWMAFGDRGAVPGAKSQPAADGCTTGCAALIMIFVFLALLGSCGRFIIHF